MAKEWDIKVSNYEGFWILRKAEDSPNYCVMRKLTDDASIGEAIRCYTADSPEEAIEKGLEIAKQYGLI